FIFFFQAEDGIRDFHVTGVQTCALPIWITPKFKSPMNRGVPDRIFMRGRLGENGVTPQLVYVEFKAPGKKPTEQQALVHKQYREMGFPVWVIDDVEEGYFLLAMHSD